MRNDYPDHPAGPLEEDPDPSQVLEIHKPRMNAWIFLSCSVVVLFISFGLSHVLGQIDAARARETGQPAPPPSSLPLGGAALGLIGLGLGIIMLLDRSVIVRLRPDGIEFPDDGLPPLRWDEVAHVDIATLVLLGAGGRRTTSGSSSGPECCRRARRRTRPP